jgi:hypothetical protein
MDRLYRVALARAGHHPPADGESRRGWRPPTLTLTLDLYRELGGAGRILAEYVTRALQEEMPKRGGDPNLARTMLKAMVTAQKTKAALDEAELVAEVAATSPDFDPAADLAALAAVRKALVDLRLVRSFQLGERAMFELAHDHIAAEIATWISAEELAAKAVQELLRRELDSWRRHGLLIAPEALRLIHEQRESLRRLTRDETELLLRSALAIGYEVPYWFERACEADVAADAIALEGLRSDNFRTRAAAATALGQLDDRFADALIPLLADLYPQVRSAAIGSLERLRPDGAWRKHLKYECYVPAGEFIMGEGEEAHRVNLRAFYIGKYPITNTEYQRFMADRGRGFEVPAGKESHPVVDVSWYDARDYADWAGMRLLTEAEWEKAASWEPVDKETRKQVDKGRKRKYPWGDEFDKTKCNTSESGIGTTMPVGKYSPTVHPELVEGGDSFYGCADMAGNVWEWCSSLYKDYPYRTDDGREDMTSSDARVVRGGSFTDNERDARCAARYYWYPYNRRRKYGFRVGWSAPSSGLW